MQGGVNTCIDSRGTRNAKEGTRDRSNQEITEDRTDKQALELFPVANQFYETYEGLASRLGQRSVH